MGRRTTIAVPIEELLTYYKYVGDLPKPEYCGVPQCARPSHTMSLCKAHYSVVQRYRSENNMPKSRPDFEDIGQYLLPAKGPHEIKASQIATGCGYPKCIRPHAMRGLCLLHYSRYMARTSPAYIRVLEKDRAKRLQNR